MNKIIGLNEDRTRLVYDTGLGFSEGSLNNLLSVYNKSNEIMHELYTKQLEELKEYLLKDVF